jgi:multiple sugar transport system substrate-binding protein
MSNHLKVILLDFIAFRKALAWQIELFKKSVGDIEIDVDFIKSYQELYDVMIGRGGVFSGEYDVFLCLTDWFPELIRMRGITPLDPYIEQNPPEDWLVAWPNSLLQLQRDEKGRIYGFPYHDGPLLLMYRRDLFENEKERQKFKELYGKPLKIPETWSEFLEVAKFFTRPDENIYGTVVAAYPDGHMNVYDFLLHLYSRGGRLLDENLNPIFNSPEGVNALQFYVDLIWKYGVAPKESLQLNCHKAGQYYLDGKAAIVWQWAGFACMAEMQEYSKVVGKNGYALLPRGEGPNARSITLNVYWAFTIPSGSKQKDLAYEFIRFLASKQSDKITTLCGAIGCRRSTWYDDEVLRKWPFYAILERLHENAESTPQIPEYAKINEVLNKAIDDAVNLRKTVKEALDDAAIKVKEILRGAKNKS